MTSWLPDLVAVLGVIGVVGTGLMAGLFFIVSNALMPALRRLPPAEGATAMRQVNRVILNPLFGLVFGGTAVVCLALAVAAPFAAADGAMWSTVGALLYMVGGIGITAFINVPMNNRLDAADPSSSAGQQIWADYLSRWTAWNHVRAVACTAATAALAIGLGFAAAP